MEKKLIAPHATLRQRHTNLRHGVYLAMMFFSFYEYFVLYINSSFLRQFTSDQFINILYILGASLSLCFFFLMPAILHKYGSFRVIAGLILVEMIATIGLAASLNLATVTAFFIIYISLPSLLLFSLDLYLERCTERNIIGQTRALYFTIGNCIVAISPIVVGYILNRTNFQTIYLISFLFLVPLLFLAVSEFKNIAEPKKAELRHPRISLAELFIRREVGIIFITDFILQFFYSIMVIYMPLYLSRTIGLNWTDIGIVFTIMLLPFVLFELPLGRIADKRLGEKEILITGFLIAAASTLVIPYMTSTFFLAWALLLFVTRIGASFIEVANEAYFFKRARPEDTALLSLYRGAIPLSYIIGPLAAGIMLLFFPISALFTMLGVVLLIGMLFASKLHDTK